MSNRCRLDTSYVSYVTVCVCHTKFRTKDRPESISVSDERVLLQCVEHPQHVITALVKKHASYFSTQVRIAFNATYHGVFYAILCS